MNCKAPNPTFCRFLLMYLLISSHHTVSPRRSTSGRGSPPLWPLSSPTTTSRTTPSWSTYWPSKRASRSSSNKCSRNSTQPSPCISRHSQWLQRPPRRAVRRAASTPKDRRPSTPSRLSWYAQPQFLLIFASMYLTYVSYTLILTDARR